VIGVDLFGQRNIADWLVTSADLVWKNGTAGWWLISQADGATTTS
jgi:hypothetical protein